MIEKEFSARFERMLMQVLLYEEDALSRLTTLIKPEIFKYSKEYFLISNTIFSFYGKTGTLPTPEVIEEIVQDLSNIEETAKKLTLMALKKLKRPTPSEKSYVLSRIREYLQKNEVITTLEKGWEHARRGEVEKVYDLFRQITSYGTLTQFDVGCMFFDNVRKRFLKKMIEPDLGKVPTFIRELDDILRGGLMPKELGVIVALPNRGKSMFLVNVARAALFCGLKIIYYTLELSTAEVEQRFASVISGVPMTELLEEHKIEKVIKQLETTSVKYKGNLIIKEFSVANVDTLKSHIMIVSDLVWVPDLIIVDYGDILSPTRTFKERRLEEGLNFLELRNKIAKELSIPVWTASQANRASKSKEIIDEEDIAESWDKIKHADFIASLNYTPQEGREGRATLFVIKNRRYITKVKVPIAIDFGKAYVGEEIEGTDYSSNYRRRATRRFVDRKQDSTLGKIKKTPLLKEGIDGKRT